MKKIIGKISLKTLNGLGALGLFLTVGLSFLDHKSYSWFWIVPLGLFVFTVTSLKLYKQWQAGERKLVNQKLWRFGFFMVLSVGIFIYFLN